MTAAEGADPPRSALARFLAQESAGGVLLVVAALVALALANSPLAPAYGALLDLPRVGDVGEVRLAKPLLLWINDGLMAVFFLAVGLEIKREVLEGELSSVRKAALPAIAVLRAACCCRRSSTSRSTPATQRALPAGRSRPRPTSRSPSACWRWRVRAFPARSRSSCWRSRSSTTSGRS
jgi:hypothetical protein